MLLSAATAGLARTERTDFGDGALVGRGGVVVRLRLAIHRYARGAICAAAEPLELAPGLIVPVADAGDLLALAVVDRDYQGADLLVDHADQRDVNGALEMTEKLCRFADPPLDYSAAGAVLRAVIDR